MKYWVYLNGEVPGSFEPSELARIHDFSDASMVCPAEGSVADRNWQRAGLFPDIVKAIEAHRSVRPPLAPPNPADYLEELGSFPLNPEEILTGTSQKLFQHVSELMKELESRREEQALTQTLERSLAQTKNELMAARERINFLEDKVSLIPGYEDRERHFQDHLNRAKGEIKDRDAAVADLRRTLEDARRQLADARQKQEETAGENKNLERWVDDLNKRIADKEMELAKALAILQKLEKQLRLMTPVPVRRPEPQEMPKPKAVSDSPKPPEAGLRDIAVGEASAAEPGQTISEEDAPSQEQSSAEDSIETPETAGPASVEPPWLRWANRLKDQFFPH